MAQAHGPQTPVLGWRACEESAPEPWCSQVFNPAQEGDLGGYLKRRTGRLLAEDEIMAKLVQVVLGLHHVHSRVRGGPCTGLRPTKLLVQTKETAALRMSSFCLPAGGDIGGFGRQGCPWPENRCFHLTQQRSLCCFLLV